MSTFFVSIILLTDTLTGQDHAGHSHEGNANGEHLHGGETLAFYLPDWKSMHFDDAKQAAQQAETVKRLGCEVKLDSHDGHSDVAYRTTTWKEMKVKDHKMAEQWAVWLRNAGFDVSHSHPDPAFAKGAEVVEFRMVKWKQMHGDEATNDKQMIEMLKKIGAEVREDAHDGHSDIAFRAPTWRDIHVADHSSADQFTKWLKQAGFETRHEDAKKQTP